MVRVSDAQMAVRSVYGKSAGALPNDVNPMASSRGLLRPPSFLRAVIINNEPLLPVVEPAGVYLNARGFKHTYSPNNAPTQREIDLNGGGSHFRRRRAMAFLNP